MASKKSSPRHKGRTKKIGSRTKRSSFKRFITALITSTAVSFMVATWALNPQLLDDFSIERILAHLELGEHQQLAPVARSSDGYAQTSFSECREFFPNRNPPTVPAGGMLRELCFTPFAILHNGQTKTPLFVAQRLNRQMLTAGQGVRRTDRFYEEGRLPRTERATLGDYSDSGFDRGHLAPAGDMHNVESMAQSFSLANIVPQDAQHNRGVWSKIENDTRKYVMRARGDVYIFTGAVHAERPQTIGSRRVAVPTYLFKMVYDGTTGRSWVHWHANKADVKVGPPISYDEFVKRTGLRFLLSI